MIISIDVPHRTSLGEIIFQKGQLAGTFSGWGTQRIIAVSVAEKQISVIADSTEKNGIISSVDSKPQKSRAKQTVLESVSIAGCDLLGSCLYTAGVCASHGGKVVKSSFRMSIYFFSFLSF